MIKATTADTSVAACSTTTAASSAAANDENNKHPMWWMNDGHNNNTATTPAPAPAATKDGGACYCRSCCCSADAVADDVAADASNSSAAGGGDCSNNYCKCWSYWRNMVVYWLVVGHSVAILNNYYHRLFKSLGGILASARMTLNHTPGIEDYWYNDNSTRRILHTLLALVVTIGCQLELDTRFTDFGRGGGNCMKKKKKSDGDPDESSTIALSTWLVVKRWIPVFVFTICNGFFETFIFLATYDFGKSLLVGNGNAESSSSSDGNATASILLGFTFYYFYMALIHVFFWLPYGLPPHTVEEYHNHRLMKKSNNESKSMATISTKSTNILPPRKPPPFHKHGLPLLTIISITWLSVYETYQD